MKIKIFGERNTSTNALKEMLETNSASRVLPSTAIELDAGIRPRLARAQKLRLPQSLRERMSDRVFEARSPLEAWKHRLTDFENLAEFADCHLIFCVRHPASWVFGLHRRPYHIHGRPAKTLDAFLDKRWRTVGREGLGRSKTSATMLYNRKMAAFVGLQARLKAAGLRYSVVRHEDFAMDQAAVFARLAPHLSQPAVTFRPLDASTKDQRRTRAYYQDYYGQQLWRDEIDQQSMARIKAEIDWSLVDDLYYTPS